MVTWLLLGMALYLLGAYLPSLMLISGIGVGKYLGSRDEEPTQGLVHGRALRAHRNFTENLPVFLALGILSLVVADADTGQALLGAQLFVLSRPVYLALYLRAVPVARSGAFLVGWVGLIMMALALL